MNSIEALFADIPPVLISETGTRAFDVMTEYRLAHIPVTENGVFSGMLYMDALLTIDEIDKPIGQLAQTLHPLYVTINQHMTKAISRLASGNLSCIAVVDDQMLYEGMVTLESAFKALGNLPMFRDKGGILEIEMNIRDYMLSDVINIVEQNDSRILGLYTDTQLESQMIRVTVKLNNQDMMVLMKEFERRGIDITVHDLSWEESDDLRQRYEHLVHYLNL
ncbi:MAG TPA: hypothetical protein DDX92_10595 [Flavobacteriales bacterium]|jgi:acetoin utilization protein AcuB|nr:hypothetical protein [Flavobacteriales bacterium]